MNYLITGIGGFVGPHLVRLLAPRDGCQLFGLSRNPAEIPAGVADRVSEIHPSQMDSVEGLRSILEKVQPDRIVHLASRSSVGESWNTPAETFFNNSNIFLNLLEAIRLSGGNCRLLSVGSSEQYGNHLPRDTGFTENDSLDPTSPYAVARVAQEQLARVYAQGFDLDIVSSRSFNHIGPGQSDRFAVSALARRFVEAAAGQEQTIRCGNLDVVRDFVDVRDVTAAYLCLLESGQSGEIYNICTGTGTSLRDIVGRFADLLGIDPQLEQDPKLLRPLDNPVVIGDSSRIQQLGWRPEFTLQQSLLDVISDWQTRLA